MEKLIINDIPLPELGAILAPDSYKSVLMWSKFKSLQSNDWAEYNYTEYDLTSPKLDKRSVTLNFHANGANGYNRFMEYLLQYVYSYYEFPELGVTLRMRIDTNSLKSIDGKWQSFSINFFDDEPYRQQSAVVRFQNFRDTGYELDNVDLAKYGISILKGSYQSFVQIPQLKERLTISENSMDGAIYDHGSDIKFKQRSFTLKCLLRAETLQYAVANYYYIYELLRQSGARKIMYKNLRCNCFYNSCNVTAVHSKMSSGNAGIAFDVTFNVVDFAKDYDSRIEYLESNGNQYILTGLSTTLIAEFTTSVATPRSTSTTFYTMGTDGSGTNTRFSLGYSNTGNIQIRLGDYYNPKKFVIGKFNIITVNRITGKYKLDGVVGNGIAVPTSKVNSGTFPLFRSRGNTGSFTSVKGFVRIASFSAKGVNDELLIDLIPVRKNSIGYMYDRVSGRLFGNDGTENFILGNDIND